MIIAVGNIGSTSLKSKIIKINEKNDIEILGEANLDKIKTEGESNFFHRIGSGESKNEIISSKGYEAGIKYVLDWYVKNNVIKNYKEIEALGFKCVMGKTNGANQLTPKILNEMEKYLFVAPVHNKPYIEAIYEFRNILDVPMVGVFEPSYHYSIPEFRKLLCLPWKWYELGIKKYGFHSASHRYLSAMAFKLMRTENIKLLNVHLGGSSSICAVKNGESVDIDQSFSPNSGLIQGTRVGDTDGSAVLFAMKELGISVDQAQNELSNNSGLRGIAGIGTDDMKEMLYASKNGNERARMAINLYIDGIRKHIGALSTTLEGLDCLVFGGGIGENSTHIREKSLEGFDYMGIKLDATKNKQLNGRLGCISSDYSVNSRTKIYIVPTNEEIVVAFFTKKVLEKGGDLSPEEMKFRL